MAASLQTWFGKGAALAFVFALTLLTSACGRRSQLDPPPDPSATVKSDSEKTENPLGVKRHKDQIFQKPNQPFVFDSIL